MQLSALKVKGPDAADFLQRQSSNDITKLVDGSGSYVSFLDPHGKIKALAYLQKQADCYLIFSTLESNLEAHLSKFIIIEDVELEALEMNDDLQQIASNVSLEEFQAGDTLIKLDLLDKYVDFDKGCFPGQEVLSKYKNLGLKKREERSQKYLDEALEIFHTAPAEGEAAKKANNQAIELLEKAIAENSNNEDAYESLGVILGREARYQEAIEIMKKLEEINPKSIMAQTNLSIFYMKIGDKETAEEYKAKGTILQFDEALKKN